MVERIAPADAARALAEIGRRREQVIRQAIIPNWFWLAIGASMLALTAGVEVWHGILRAVGIIVFVIGVLTTVGAVVVRVVRVAPPRRGLVDPRAAMPMLIGIGTFTAVVVGVTLAIGFSLKLAKVSYPATITVAAAALLLAIGGPMLMRYLTDVILGAGGRT
jgi:hypothetical protein